MIINSVYFFLAFFLVVILNWYVGKSHRLLFLTLTSLFFLAFWNLETLTSLLCFASLNYLLAKKVSKNKTLFIIGILINVLIILHYNYLLLIPHSDKNTDIFFHFNFTNLFLSLGLTYYTLQNIAYLIEVRYKRITNETNFIKFLFYSAIFTKASSGPIMLPQEFLPQLNNITISNEKLIIGFKRILLGLFKKLVIADRLAPAVSSVFDSHSTYSGITILCALYLFTIQLYFDFSGYTDIAIGATKMIGIDLKENFNLPLRSLSVTEFWRRWHISLISFFTKYIYYPLVYRLRKHKRNAAIVGLSVTFILSGIWHRISFTFFFWAICHITYLTFELFTKRIRITTSERFNSFAYKLISALIVFNLVCFSNIFFRATSLHKAFLLIKNSFQNFFPTEFNSGFIAPLAVGGHQIDKFNFYISVCMAIALILFERKINSLALKNKFSIFYVVFICVLIFVFGIFNNGARFIYMQF